MPDRGSRRPQISHTTSTASGKQAPSTAYPQERLEEARTWSYVEGQEDELDIGPRRGDTSNTYPSKSWWTSIAPKFNAPSWKRHLNPSFRFSHSHRRLVNFLGLSSDQSKADEVARRNSQIEAWLSAVEEARSAHEASHDTDQPTTTQLPLDTQSFEEKVRNSESWWRTGLKYGTITATAMGTVYFAHRYRTSIIPESLSSNVWDWNEGRANGGTGTGGEW